MVLLCGTIGIIGGVLVAEKEGQETAAKRAFIDGVGPGWKSLGEEDFADVNGDEDTWQFKDGMIYSTGKPVGVLRTAKQYKNLEMVVEWRHLVKAGNSGTFLWVPEEVLKDLPPNKLPGAGIEVQMLDLGYRERFIERNGKEPDWFTCHGDVFAVGASKMKPFAPISPNGRRSFPTKDLSNGVGEWNHYYVRAINGEVRLWVNGEEVSGGSDCQPSSGFLCLEAEGSAIEFRNLRIRELP
jgi:hypothetical protein